MLNHIFPPLLICSAVDGFWTPCCSAIQRASLDTDTCFHALFSTFKGSWLRHTAKFCQHELNSCVNLKYIHVSHLLIQMQTTAEYSTGRWNFRQPMHRPYQKEIPSKILICCTLSGYNRTKKRPESFNAYIIQRGHMLI